jgi:mRNA interferase HigB
MNLIAFRTIREFYEQHPATKNALRTWYTILKHENWTKPQDVVRTFGTLNVDILKNDRVCVDVKGNNIRIILSVNYKSNTAYIKWIGWHKDYDKLGNNIHTINSTLKK